MSMSVPSRDSVLLACEHPGMAHHDYRLAVRWDDRGVGTLDYRTYSRQFTVTSAGKSAPFVGSADPHFRGDATRYNPEELLVIALSSCHLLSYLALCARAKVEVVAYTDEAHGRMVGDHARGHFEAVVLRPQVTLAPGADAAVARALHHDAHASCYIAASVRFPVTCEPTINIRPAP